jgi:serine phosphatase RsbU (regulator of sigma subunit)/anti-sigma regulatory factor (Ser/Thr protein kinase)
MKQKDTLSREGLSRLVDQQSAQLQTVTKTLAKVREEIDEENEMARNVQFALMPRELPEFINMDISAIYIPAGKVGGDFYDVMLTPSQKVAVLIFDVSGHGVPAALIGAVAKMLFANYLEVCESPAEIFRKVNSQLCSHIKTDHYLTAFLGIIDPVRNSMKYSRAGHVFPVVYHQLTKDVSFIESRGFFIGHAALIDIAEYTEEEINFESEDKVLFYTDGLTEGSNPQHELYGSERLSAMVKTYGYLPPDELLSTILKDQETFRNGAALRDDFTMLCIQVGDAEHLLKESGFIRDDLPKMLVIREMCDIERLCPLILKTMDKCGFYDKEIRRLKLCLYELIINSIHHGHQYDAKKRVLVLYTITPEKAAISIVDEGSGFDYTAVPNPLDSDNILKEHGRGIYIVRQFTDEMHYNKKGNRILIVKYHTDE